MYRSGLLVLLFALPGALPALQQSGAAHAALAPERQPASELAGRFLLTAARSGSGAATTDAARAIQDWLNHASPAATSNDATGAVPAVKLEPLFLWALGQQPAADSDLPRSSFAVGERLSGWGLFTGRAPGNGGLDLALSGETLIVIRPTGGTPVALRHDFGLQPMLTVPVETGAEIFILPLGRGDLLDAGRAPLSLGFTAFNPLFPFELTGLSAEPMGRAAVIHFETENEQGIARFELQRAARPETGWRMIAQLPATGGGDYHVIDSRFPGHAYYRLVPILTSGQRAAPSMLLSVGEGAPK
jgi:hypothetical protein